jgi:hypothetical protein
VKPVELGGRAIALADQAVEPDGDGGNVQPVEQLHVRGQQNLPFADA